MSLLCSDYAHRTPPNSDQKAPLTAGVTSFFAFMTIRKCYDGRLTECFFS
jgi:hypothetical protein